MQNRTAARALPLALLLLALPFSGCTGANDSASFANDDAPDVAPQAVTGTPGAVGGAVRNTPPVVESFTASATTGDNRGAFTVVFTGLVRESNTERQLANLSVAGSGAVPIAATHAVTPAETDATTEPDTFGADGFRVWTGTRNDGLLNVKWRYTFPAFTPAGTYAFTLSATDKAGASASSAAVGVVVTAFSDVTILATPVAADGTLLTGQSWGQWDAEPGATNVAATNYAMLTNSGSLAAPRVVIDFADAFVGAEDANFTIPAAGNVEFAWWEGPASSAPRDGSFVFQPANAEGSATLRFSSAGSVIYVTYRIVQMPDVLPAQGYGISYTVTEL